MSEIAEFTKHLGHYLPAPDVALVSRAFEFSESAHRGQFRKSGEPYITHPLAVASILSQWRLDAQGLAAALLHDVMEDTSVTKGELEKKFGKPVADMVDGVSKLDQIEFDSREEAQAESFRKMLLAMARDVRVILIKLADRLHNMRTLDAMAQAHKKRIAKETLDIYAPIANRLGLNALFLELQDLCFKHLYPMRYRILAKAIKAARGNRREVMNRLLDVIREGFAKSDLIAVVTGREKTIFSVYKKMREKHYTFSQVFDIYGVRVLVAGQDRRAMPRWACCTSCTSRSPASSRTTSPSRRPTATSRCTRRCSARSARRWKCRSARTTCIVSRKQASRRTGCTSPAANSTWPRRRRRRRAGCRACSRSSRSRATPRNSWSTSRATCSPTRSTCSRRRARSWRCRAAPPPSISPTACTPTSAITASRRASTMNCCRCARN